jgi:hypothetical protein
MNISEILLGILVVLAIWFLICWFIARSVVTTRQLIDIMTGKQNNAK